MSWYSEEDMSVWIPFDGHVPHGPELTQMEYTKVYWKMSFELKGVTGFDGD